MAIAKAAKLTLSLNTRQKARRAILLVTFLAFPLTYKYLSPYTPIDGAVQGIITGSLIYFAFLFVVSLVFGRAVCGWACPAAGMQEWSAEVSHKNARGGRLNWIKYFIWVPWLGIIIAMFVMAGGFLTVEPLYLIDGGISVAAPSDYIVYFMVVSIILLLSLAVGKRAFCHYGCWMAPFMILGTRLKNLLGLPSLHLESTTGCKQCHACTGSCPMSLPVAEMVAAGNMKHDECILCGTCVDTCPRKVIRFSWGMQ